MYYIIYILKSLITYIVNTFLKVNGTFNIFKIVKISLRRIIHDVTVQYRYQFSIYIQIYNNILYYIIGGQLDGVDQIVFSSNRDCNNVIHFRILLQVGHHSIYSLLIIYISSHGRFAEFNTVAG